ncbi:hypothetical protein GCM10011273_17840 [Asticcacaulis endophyticus]|uniref:Uncharacterized protein n=1 Tax=Asticcacaulis endophyticus TaxID=1395890 RepID=A0A918UT14_9CAUL|nr:hypothetical protein GCM10011273_17840 [Asticcacaulis endophyticus]
MCHDPSYAVTGSNYHDLRPKIVNDARRKKSSLYVASAGTEIDSPRHWSSDVGNNISNVRFAQVDQTPSMRGLHRYEGAQHIQSDSDRRSAFLFQDYNRRPGCYRQT